MSISTTQFHCILFFLCIHVVFSANTYQVGDLNAWGLPPSSNSRLYSIWPKSHNFTVGDRLFFLYPPSQDSLIQVTKESFASCNVTDPILYMDDGNSVFNITQPGEFYFTSGVDGHCQKLQKLHVFVYGAGSLFESPDVESPAAAAGPSYPTTFGSIPMQQAAGDAAATVAGILPVAVIGAAAIGMLWM